MKKSTEKRDNIIDADFETAISACGLGKFNLFLLSLAIPSYFATNFDSTTISYVVPAARCDLNFSLEQGGTLAGISYLGMVLSAFMWGFLADTLGRKKILVICYSLHGLLLILAGFSQSYEMLISVKFITGFIVNGPFVTLTSMLSEYHSLQRRAQVMLYIGLIYGIANSSMPLLAWLIIPNDWDIKYGNFELHSWNFFIMLSAFPSILSAIGHIFVPESPKYLMTAGRNEEALKVFRKVFHLNTGKEPSDYAVKSLVRETNRRVEHKSSIQALKHGFAQIKPLFFQPYLLNFVLMCIIETGLITSMNSLRLWLPQIFTIISYFKINFPEKTNPSLCEMLEIATPTKIANSTIECVKSSNDSSVYTNVLIVSLTTILAFLIAEVSINKLGKKPMLILLSLISGSAGFSIYFAQNEKIMTGLTSINNSLVTVCTDVCLAIIVDVFPTTLRTVALSSIMMIARIGTMTGTSVFPLLLKTGCLPPFLAIGLVIFVCALLAFMLPNTDNKALE